jgi:hypothetical protein
MSGLGLAVAKLPWLDYLIGWPDAAADDAGRFFNGNAIDGSSHQ